ncbi:MAG TPA: hypothetical protein VG013_17530, partial [Gemmataceae bacterium]|nr:hypothetical protein [Gemmataceae bacterium]
MKVYCRRLLLPLGYLFRRPSHQEPAEHAPPCGVRRRRPLRDLEILEDRIAAGSMLPLPGFSGVSADLGLASLLGADLSPSPAVYYPPRQGRAAAGGPKEPPDNSAVRALSVLGGQVHDSPAGTAARTGSGGQDLDAKAVDEIFGAQAGGPLDAVGDPFLTASQTSPDPELMTSADAAMGSSAAAAFAGTRHPSSGTSTAAGGQAGAVRLGTSGLTQPSPGGTTGQSGTVTNQQPPPQVPPDGDGGSSFQSIPPVPPSSANTGYIGSTTLLNLFQSHTSTGSFTAAQKLTFQFDQHNGMDRVLVNVRGLPSANLSQMQQYLQSAQGMTVTTVTPAQNLITGYLPIFYLRNLTSVPGFAAVTPVYAPLHFAGPGTTSVASLIKADAFAATTGDNGTGVTVGDLSNSINQG